MKSFKDRLNSFDPDRRAASQEEYLRMKGIREEIPIDEDRCLYDRVDVRLARIAAIVEDSRNMSSAESHAITEELNAMWHYLITYYGRDRNS